MEEPIPFGLALPDAQQAVPRADGGREDLLTSRRLEGLATVRDGALVLQFRVLTRVRRRRWVFNAWVHGFRPATVDDETQLSETGSITIPATALHRAETRGTGWFSRRTSLVLTVADLRALEALPGAFGADLRLEIDRANRAQLIVLRSELQMAIADAQMTDLLSRHT